MEIIIPKFLEKYLEPQPGPPGLTSREIVRRAIEFDGPPRLPYSFLAPFGSDFFEAIIVRFMLPETKALPPREKGAVYYDEWGVGQKVTGRSWDHAFDYPLADLNRLEKKFFHRRRKERREIYFEQSRERRDCLNPAKAGPSAKSLPEGLRSFTIVPRAGRW